MKGLSDTLSRLSSLRTMSAASNFPGDDRLTDVSFDDNPGALRARCYVPPNLSAAAPLVVALHGCTQTAAGYDAGTAWSHVAEENAFAVLFPEQQRGNNPNLCFNWFLPSDTKRDIGEVASIRAMIDAMISKYSLDRSRVFITGLSAGGAMSSAMLDAYPDMFASGAIIAGLPPGVANSMPEAFNAMRGQSRTPRPSVSSASRPGTTDSKRLPTISVWHGTADRTVASSNGDAVVDHWRAMYGLAAEPTRIETLAGHRRSVWCDSFGREVIEYFSIAGMAHGLPINPSHIGTSERVGPFMLDVGISSTRHIANFWGIAPPVKVAVALREQATIAPAATSLNGDTTAATGWHLPQPSFADRHSKGGVGEVIENALRAAGLMK